MKNIKFTHSAIEIGVDYKIDSCYRKCILLRETKTMFIGNNGRRFRKKDGYVIGKQPRIRLIIQSIEKIEE